MDPPRVKEFKKGKSKEIASAEASGAIHLEERERTGQAWLIRLRIRQYTTHATTSSNSSQLAHSRDKGIADSFSSRI